MNIGKDQHHTHTLQQKAGVMRLHFFMSRRPSVRLDPSILARQHPLSQSQLHWNCQCVNCNGLEPHSPGIDPVGLSKEVRASVGDKEHGQHQHFVVLSLRPGALKQLLLVFKST